MMAATQVSFFSCYYFALQCCQLAKAQNSSFSLSPVMQNTVSFSTVPIANNTATLLPYNTSMAITSTINVTQLPMNATVTVTPTVRTSLPTSSTNTTQSPTGSGVKLETWKYIAIGAGGGVAVIIVIVIVACCCFKVKQNKTRVLPSGTTNQMEPVEDEHHLVPPPTVEK